MNFIGGPIITENARPGSRARVARASQIFVDTPRGRALHHNAEASRVRTACGSGRPCATRLRRMAKGRPLPQAVLTAIEPHSQLVGAPEWKTDMMLASISSWPA